MERDSFIEPDESQPLLTERSEQIAQPTGNSADGLESSAASGSVDTFTVPSPPAAELPEHQERGDRRPEDVHNPPPHLPEPEDLIKVSKKKKEASEPFS